MIKIILFGCLLFASQLIAIEKSTVTWSAGGLSIGLVKIDFSGLNSLLAKYDYPNIPKKLFVIGGGGMGVVNGAIPLGGFGFGGEITRSKANRYIKLDYGGGGFVPGYGFSTKKEAFVGIVVTIGGFGFNLKLTKRPEKLPTAEEIVDDPTVTGSASIAGGGFSVGVGLMGYYRIGILTIGGRIGRLFFPIFKWFSDDLGIELPELSPPKSARYCILDIYFGGPPAE